MKNRTLTMVRNISWLVVTLVFSSGDIVLAGDDVWQARSGQVVDEKSGTPIAGAFVIDRWVGTMANNGANQACYHVEVAVTDHQGRYTIPQYTDEHFSLLDKHVLVSAYKEGYVLTEDNKDGGVVARMDRNNAVQYRMTMDKRTINSRLKYLHSLGNNLACAHGDGSEKSLLSTYNAIRHEEKYFSAMTSADSVGDTVLYKINKIAIDNDSAAKHQQEREAMSKPRPMIYRSSEPHQTGSRAIAAPIHENGSVNEGTIGTGYGESGR